VMSLLLCRGRSYEILGFLDVDKREDRVGIPIITIKDRTDDKLINIFYFIWFVFRQHLFHVSNGL